MRGTIIYIVAVSLMCCKTFNARGQTDKPVVFSLNLKILERNKTRISNKDPEIMAAYKQLIKDANKALEFGPVSVMEKKNMPPSGDKHDYMSLAPYYWPDPTKA